MTKKGLTVIEIIVAVAILAILASLTVAGLANFRQRQSLTATAEQLATLLARARSETLASRNHKNYGVHLEVDRATLFTGPTYSGSGEELLFSPAVVASTTLSGGGSDVVFGLLTGNTSNWGTTTLMSGNQSQNLVIDTSGLVYLK